jgi:hypothetical protein
VFHPFTLFVVSVIGIAALIHYVYCCPCIVKAPALPFIPFLGGIVCMDMRHLYDGECTMVGAVYLRVKYPQAMVTLREGIPLSLQYTDEASL